MRDRYDFDLTTGKSDTGLRACTYAVEVKGDGCVYMEAPEDGTNWRVVELRPVSEGVLSSKRPRARTDQLDSLRGSPSSGF